MAHTPHLLPAHIAAFQRACRLHNVAILVRQTNAASLRWFDHPRTTPKMIDCKAKTADRPFHANGRTYDVAGLVVDPTITGPEAFSPAKFQSAKAEWRGFAQTMLAPPETDPKHTMVWHGRRFYQYFVETNPASPFYACVLHTPTTLRAAGKAIHGDFDLYAIIDLDDPSANVRVAEEFRMMDHKDAPSIPHTRSPKFRDVQIAINGRMALNMPAVRHGAQETFKSQHTDEPVDVFFPDGTMMTLRNKQEIEQFYATRLKGRQLFAGKDAGKPHKGLYRKA